MAELIKIAAEATPDSDRPPELPLFRFSLRHLFWMVTGVSVLAAAAAATAPGITPLVVILAVVVVVTHVTATAIGSRLRAHADRLRSWESSHHAGEDQESNRVQQTGVLSTSVLPPCSPWYHRGSTTVTSLPKCIAGGALLGSMIGGVLLSLSIGHRISFGGIAIGAISLAVIGAWFGFVGGSFYSIFRHGLRDAMSQQRSDELAAELRRR